MLASLVAPILFALPAAPTDEVVLVDGRVITVERVTGESYSEVTYKTLGGGAGRKPAEQVAEVIHDYSSPLLDDFVLGLEEMDSGDFAAAVGTFNSVLADGKLMKRSRYAWVKQHALQRKIRCLYSLADYAAVAQAVDQLLQEVPDTFFYAPMLLLKAESLAAAGDVAGGEDVYRDLAAAVEQKGLPERWAREADLGKVLANKAMQGLARRRALQQLAEENKDRFPTVASRARVEIGNTMMSEGDFAGAKDFFQAIVDEGAADARTVAAAYAGLGTCSYHFGLAAENKAEADPWYEKAALAHLRVVTLYKEQVALVPQSLYYSAAALNRMGGKGNQEKVRVLASRMSRNFPSSPWLKKLGEELGVRLASGSGR